MIYIVSFPDLFRNRDDEEVEPTYLKLQRAIDHELWRFQLKKVFDSIDEVIVVDVPQKVISQKKKARPYTHPFRENDPKWSNILKLISKLKICNINELDKSFEYCTVTEYASKDLREFLRGCNSVRIFQSSTSGYLDIPRNYLLELKYPKEYLEALANLEECTKDIDRNRKRIRGRNAEVSENIFETSYNELFEEVFGRFEELFRGISDVIDLEVAENPWVLLNSNDMSFVKETVNALYKENMKNMHFAEVVVTNDIPEIEPEKDVLIIYNVHKLSFQKQVQLSMMLDIYEYNKRGVIVVGNSEELSPIFQEKFNEFRFPRFEDYKDRLTDLFLFHLIDKAVITEDSMQYLKEFHDTQIFNELLKNVSSMQMLCEIVAGLPIRREDSDILFDEDFWYLVTEQINNLKSKRDYSSIPESKENPYYFRFRGDFWEVNFDYREPILIRGDLLAMFFFAFLIANKGISFTLNQLREVILHKDVKREFINQLSSLQKENPKYKFEYTPEAFEKAKKDATNRIREYEEMFEGTANLAPHLENYIKVYFKDKDFHAVYNPPGNITWQKIIPPKSNKPVQIKNNKSKKLIL
jgi:hypothetical protein